MLHDVVDFRTLWRHRQELALQHLACPDIEEGELLRLGQFVPTNVRLDKVDVLQPRARLDARKLTNLNAASRLRSSVVCALTAQ